MTGAKARGRFRRLPPFIIRAPLADSRTSSSFKLISDPQEPPAGLEGVIVAIGNFDGVHRAHAAVIARAKTLAEKLGGPCAVLTFEPHPADYFRGGEPIFRLTPLEEKAAALARLGLDGMIVLTFDASLAELSAEEFVSEILVRRLAVRAVVAGYDFHFGKGRGGSPAFLKEAGAKLGFEVDIVERISPEAGLDIEAIGSTAIRAALEAGDVARAAHLLGHDFTVKGKVVHGQKLGRTLGYPTANITTDPSFRLAHGVYAVRAWFDGASYDGVANYGRRPTFDNGAPILEAYLFDFSGELYGKSIELAFVAKIRGEEKFASVDALVAQMEKDVAEAKALLQA